MSELPWDAQPGVTIRTLAAECHNRVTALGYKGRARDRAVLDYWAGAYTALAQIDHPMAPQIGGFGAMVLSVRGWSEIVRIVNTARD